MGSLRCAIGCWLALFLGTLVAQAAPETRLLDPPTGEILQRDVLLWWEGIPEGPDAPIIGYRLRVDGQEQFTTALYQALFGLTPGEHTVEVAAFDARGEVDPTPATARFIVLEAEAFEEELNNTEETANVLALLTTITGISDVGGGPDRYRLTLPPGADRLAVMVRFREAVSPETTPIQITVQRGTVILVEEEIGGASGPRQLSAVVDVGVGPAVYAVEIAPNFDNIFLSARYALTVQPLTFSPQAYADLEPNGTPGSSPRGAPTGGPADRHAVRHQRRPRRYGLLPPDLGGAPAPMARS
ncbi:MAG: hypothetical protein KatS3mg115_0144 [Candidatus Poribacteria bacterium]|nr:MAG: hypothetical protein KatS3mg115_0144 [Candidatus Poribacteria bacterium]